MFTRLFPRLPVRGMLAAASYALCMVCLATLVALDAPRMGLRLEARPEGIQVTASTPSAALPVGARVLALETVDGRSSLHLQPEDLIDEPDLLPDYPQMGAFFERQGRLATLLRDPVVIVQWLAPGTEAMQRARLEPTRGGIATLPPLYWFQVLCCSLGCLVAAWVWVLRPDDWGVRLFGLTGLLFPLFVLPAAIYTTRELALDATTFRILSALNHSASAMFGAATVGIFLAYPRPLVRPRHLAWPFVVFGLWWVLDVLRLAPSLDWGTRAAVMTELVLAIGLFALQWHRVRGNPLERASLAWLALSLLAGTAIFLLSTVVPAGLGWFPPLPEGYAFGFFLVIYIGIALGLRRHRLFDLDVWAYRLLLWFAAALAVVLLDAALIALLGWSDALALGVAVWVAGFFYLPIRHALWARIVRRRHAMLDAALPEIIKIAFIGSAPTRAAEWTSLLRRTFGPLHIEQSPHGSSAVACVLDEGLALQVPTCAGIASCVLRHAEGGRRLFRTADARFVTDFCALMEQAETARRDQEQGVLQERRRIARDMHDDIGARLLMLIHSAVTPAQAEAARTAMEELRAALAALDRKPAPLADALADWRAEALQRCEAVGVAMNWEVSGDPDGLWLDSRRRAVLDRILRESLSNAFKHAAPHQVGVTCRIEGDDFHVCVANDGQVTDPARWREGRGLRGLRERVQSLGGVLTARLAPGPIVEMRACLPLSDGGVTR